MKLNTNRVQTACTCTRCHSTWDDSRRKKLTMNDPPWEGVKHAEDKQTNKTRKEGLKSYADMTIYAVCQARLALTLCHQKLPSHQYCPLASIQQLLYLILSSVAKMHAACSHSPQHSTSVYNSTHGLYCKLVSCWMMIACKHLPLVFDKTKVNSGDFVRFVHALVDCGNVFV